MFACTPVTAQFRHAAKFAVHQLWESGREVLHVTRLFFLHLGTEIKAVVSEEYAVRLQNHAGIVTSK